MDRRHHGMDWHSRFEQRSTRPRSCAHARRTWRWEEEDEQVRIQERSKRKRRRPASQTISRKGQTQQRRDERKKRQKKQDMKSLNAKISMSRLCQFVNTQFSGAMLGDADDAGGSWSSSSNAGAMTPKLTPLQPSIFRLSLLMKHWLPVLMSSWNSHRSRQTPMCAGKALPHWRRAAGSAFSNWQTTKQTTYLVFCAVCGEFHLPDNTDVFHLGKRTDEKTTAKPLGALLPLLKLLKNPKSRVPPPEPLQPDAPGMDILRGLYVEYKGVDADKQTITICHRCQDHHARSTICAALPHLRPSERPRP